MESSLKKVHDNDHSSSNYRGPEDDQLHDAPAPSNALIEVNMEVAVTADELMRAGGLGATDDISNIIPVASDSTDFESYLCDIRDYEESDNKISEGQFDPCKSILEDVDEHVVIQSRDGFEAVNMEASVTSDEMIRAGGFGATDNLGSFLPVASDFTDFEANLRDARGYEDLEEKINRPGLGWSSETK